MTRPSFKLFWRVIHACPGESRGLSFLLFRAAKTWMARIKRAMTVLVLKTARLSEFGADQDIRVIQ
jgi:hypothetical protein